MRSSTPRGQQQQAVEPLCSVAQAPVLHSQVPCTHRPELQLAVAAPGCGFRIAWFAHGLGYIEWPLELKDRRAQRELVVVVVCVCVSLFGGGWAQLSGGRSGEAPRGLGWGRGGLVGTTPLVVLASLCGAPPGCVLWGASLLSARSSLCALCCRSPSKAGSAVLLVGPQGPCCCSCARGGRQLSWPFGGTLNPAPFSCGCDCLWGGVPQCPARLGSCCTGATDAAALALPLLQQWRWDKNNTFPWALVASRFGWGFGKVPRLLQQPWIDSLSWCLAAH